MFLHFSCVNLASSPKCDYLSFSIFLCSFLREIRIGFQKFRMIIIWLQKKWKKMIFFFCAKSQHRKSWSYDFDREKYKLQGIRLKFNRSWDIDVFTFSRWTTLQTLEFFDRIPNYKNLIHFPVCYNTKISQINFVFCSPKLIMKM